MRWWCYKLQTAVCCFSSSVYRCWFYYEIKVCLSVRSFVDRIWCCPSCTLVSHLDLGRTTGIFAQITSWNIGKWAFFFSFFLKKSILRVHRNWDGFDLSILHRVKPVMRAEVAKSVSHVAQAAHSHSHVRKPFVGLHQLLTPTVADQLSQRVSSLYSAAVSL